MSSQPRNFLAGKIRPESKADYSAVLVMMNFIVIIEAQHIIPLSINFHDVLQETFTFTRLVSFRLFYPDDDDTVHFRTSVNIY